MDRDYVVLFDENGQPYIAHAWGKGTAHKYIEKWGEGAKARYFYTKQELEAALGRGREAVSRAADKVRTDVREVTGAAAKDRLDEAHAAAVRASRDLGKAQERKMFAIANGYKRAEDAKRAYDKALAAYSTDVPTRVYALSRDKSSAARLRTASEEKALADKKASRWITTKGDYERAIEANEKYERALDDRRRAASERRMAIKEGDKAARDLGVARSNYARDESFKGLPVYDSNYDYRPGIDDISRLERVADEERSRYEKAVEEYAKTPLAKIEAAKESAASWIKNAEETIKDYGNTAISDIKEVVSKVADKIKGTEKSTVSTEKESPSSSPAERIWERKRAAAEKALEDAYTRLRAADKADMFKVQDDPIDGLPVYSWKTARAAKAYRDARASLSNASSVDNARRAASEKRMAEKEYQHDRVYGDKWDKAYDEWKAAQAEYKRIMDEDPNASRKK